MNGLVRKSAALLGIALALAGNGCHTVDNGNIDPEACNLYDCCWPQRYWYHSRQNVNSAFAPQVQNGHVLDQTVWNHHFETGTDRLTPGGLAHLDYLARRRPCPDTTIYLQTACDIGYDPGCPQTMAGTAQELDVRRGQAIQKYLVAHTAGRPVEFQVLIHDPADPSISAVPVGNLANGSVTQMYARFRGGVGPVPGGAGGGGGGGGR